MVSELVFSLPFYSFLHCLFPPELIPSQFPGIVAPLYKSFAHQQAEIFKIIQNNLQLIFIIWFVFLINYNFLKANKLANDQFAVILRQTTDYDTSQWCFEGKWQSLCSDLIASSAASSRIVASFPRLIACQIVFLPPNPHHHIVTIISLLPLT